MIYLLWGLLNIIVALFFIALCFKATKLIREKFGLLASVVFVFGLLSFMGHANNNNDNKEPNSNQIKTWKFISMDSINKNATYPIEIDLEKSLISRCHLGIGYAKDKQGLLNVPFNAYSITTGLVCGTNWIPISIIVNRTADNNKFEYIVDGIVEWKLLGATIYSQAKDYRGIALAK